MAGVPIRITDWLRNAALLWGAFEATRHYRLLRRRQIYGLVELAVTRRFLYWGIALGGAGISSTIDAAAKLLVERAWDVPALTLLNAGAGTVAAVCLVLAFGRPTGSGPPARELA